MNKGAFAPYNILVVLQLKKNFFLKTIDFSERWWYTLTIKRPMEVRLMDMDRLSSLADEVDELLDADEELTEVDAVAEIGKRYGLTQREESRLLDLIDSIFSPYITDEDDE